MQLRLIRTLIHKSQLQRIIWCMEQQFRLFCESWEHRFYWYAIEIRGILGPYGIFENILREPLEYGLDFNEGPQVQLHHDDDEGFNWPNSLQLYTEENGLPCPLDSTSGLVDVTQVYQLRKVLLRIIHSMFPVDFIQQHLLPGQTIEAILDPLLKECNLLFLNAGKVGIPWNRQSIKDTSELESFYWHDTN